MSDILSLFRLGAQLLTQLSSLKFNALFTYISILDKFKLRVIYYVPLCTKMATKMTQLPNLIWLEGHIFPMLKHLNQNGFLPAFIHDLLYYLNQFFQCAILLLFTVGYYCKFEKFWEGVIFAKLRIQEC